MSDDSELKDLGLDYVSAMHGVQTAVQHDINVNYADIHGNANPKHLRVGVNSCQVNDAAIASLLIAKGIFTLEEYAEAVRLQANYELDRYQRLFPGVTFR